MIKVPNSILVVNMRGTVNVRRPVKETLQQLHITRRYAATIVPDTPVYQGMLAAAKDRVSWSSVQSSLIAKLLKLRARGEGWKPLDKDVISSLGFKTLKELADAIASGKARLNKLKGIKPSMGLPPPKGGFKRSTRKSYREGGILGKNPDLPKILESMLAILE